MRIFADDAVSVPFQRAGQELVIGWIGFDLANNILSRNNDTYVSYSPFELLDDGLGKGMA